MVDPPVPDEMVRLHALIADLPEGQNLEPGSARTLTAAAVSALQIGRAEDAVALARAALGLEPKSARAWSVTGDALWSLGRVHDARVAWEAAIAIDDKDLTTAVSCARAQIEDGAVAAGRALLNFVLFRSTSPELTRLATEVLEQAQ